MFTPDLFGNLAFWVFKSLWESRGDALRRVYKTVRLKLYEVSKVYEKNYVARHGIIKTYTTPRPIELDEFYICPAFLHGDVTTQPIRNLIARRNPDTEVLVNQYFVDGFELANASQFLIVLGEPGIGKTTFLKKVGLETLKHNSETDKAPDYTPIFIELQGKVETSLDLYQLVIDELKICGLPELEMFADLALGQGRLLILIDGLDEIPLGAIQDVVSQIQDFVDTHHKNRFIISCRTEAYTHNLRRFSEGYIFGFNQDHIRQYISQWLASNMVLKQPSITEVINTHQVLLKEVGYNPSFLNLFCTLFKERCPLPVKSSNLYEAIWSFLMEDWPYEKGVLHQRLYENLDLQVKEELLTTIAYYSFCDRRVWLGRRELAQQIEDVLAQDLNVEASLNRYSLLEEIQIRNGIFVEPSNNSYTFLSSKVHTFLCAYHITKDAAQLKEAIETYSENSRWRDVFITAAATSQADNLMLLLNSHFINHLNTANIHPFIAWLNRSTRHSNLKQELSVKRLLGLFLIVEMMQLLGSRPFKAHSRLLHPKTIHSLILALNSQMTVIYRLDPRFLETAELSFLLKLAVCTAEKVERTQLFEGINFTPFINGINTVIGKIQGRSVPRIVHEKVLKHVQLSWLKTLRIQEDWVSFSHEEFHSLHSYLRGCQLMMACLNESDWISSDVRTRIRAEILQIPESLTSQDGGFSGDELVQ